MNTSTFDLLRGTNLYLVGMMGVGKSTLGTAMAERLGYRFFDTDTLIEQVAHHTIPEIFDTVGETEFRVIESQVLSQLSPYTRLVIATGGGIVLNQENWWHLRQGVIVWLDVPLPELERRLQGNQNRPLLQREDWRKHLSYLLESRRRRYAEADIHLTVVAGETVEESCDRLVKRLEDRILPPPETSTCPDD
ncbi:shikimate kinase [Oscillatoria sp. CS-180]|uniref:shikimate kinase n=1 Tax=Oscillatoria sp. CS-180 TaxID=3021720 RepID=UPI00232AEA4A|nr:shikimate kinase [Oscillatoria sp. CS-180]MDB9528361.1 shikimate kinase [Oscillatoria sp. CS-180]